MLSNRLGHLLNPPPFGLGLGSSIAIAIPYSFVVALHINVGRISCTHHHHATLLSLAFPSHIGKRPASAIVPYTSSTRPGCFYGMYI